MSCHVVIQEKETELMLSSAKVIRRNDEIGVECALYKVMGGNG